jgi:hypothetical protein
VRKENNPGIGTGYSSFEFADYMEKYLFKIHPLNRQEGSE